MRKKIILSSIISLTLVLSPATSLGQTTSSPTVEELQKQIQLLLNQMSALQKEVTTLRSTTPTAPTPTASTPAPTSILPPSLYSSPLEIDESEVGETETQFVPPPNLTRSLFRGSRGEDVRQLQEFLAQDPAIYPEGIATGYYGVGTERAVRRWQAKNGVPAVGVIGRQTIAKFRELYGTIARPVTPPTTPPFPCPAVYSPQTCPAGEERYLVSDPLSYSSCPIYACRPKDKRKPEICPSLPTVDSCPAGEERITTYKSEQCGVYYACKPREISRADNTIATLKKISPIQTDNRYTVNLYDPEGVQKFAVYGVKGTEIHLGYPACRKEWSSPVISADSAEFPLKLSLTDCASSQYSITLSTSVVVKPIEEGLTFPYKFSNGKIVYSSEEARAYCYANGPASGIGIAGECETKFGVTYTQTTTTTGRAIYLSDSFAGCMAKYGFTAEAKQIKIWAQSPEAIPWSALTSAAQNTVPVCEREYYGHQTIEAGPTLCSDGRDNDGDGFTDSADPSCSVTTTTTGGQKEQIWNSLGLKSWIRTDADSARVDQLKAACASVKPNSNVWTANAGLATSADFGMPDSSKCSRAAVCTASQIFDGSACVTSTTTTTGTSQCSDGRDNDGDGLIDYPSDTGCYSSADNDETPGTTTTTGDSCSQYGSGWHSMSAGLCFDTNMTNYRTANGTLYSCSTTPTTGCSGTTTTTTTNPACSDGRDNDGDGLIDYPSDTGCYSSADTDETPSTTTTTTSSCPNSQLTALLGSGCHFMYSTPTGNIYCDGPMTKSAREGEITATSGCQAPTTTTTLYEDSVALCSDGIDNDRDGLIDSADPSCASYTTTTTTTTTSSCPNSQLTALLGSGCHFMYSTPTGNIYCDGPMTKSAREGDTAATTGCQSPTTTTTTTTTTSCAGTPVSCTNETQCAGASYYWYDATCHSSPQTTTTTCPSGQYWNGTACVSSTTTTTTTTTTTSSCPSGYHSMGSYCMSDSNSTQCQPTGGGAVYTCSSTPTASVYDVTLHTTAQIRTVLRSLQNSLSGLRR